MRERFLLEAEAQGIASFQQLNDRFTAWSEQVCNTRVHAETGQPPIDCPIVFSIFTRTEPPATVGRTIIRTLLPLNVGVVKRALWDTVQAETQCWPSGAACA